ncbi:MAG TPA: phosphoribosyltransferase family protein [Pyrinomonadaceae bacterium]|nr:phosphoribosyltransferase family protein [Pyrinomonadaceae bacterium]
MVQLVPTQDEVMAILKRTGAFREGHFVYPSGRHTPHYFQMPLAFRYYDTARVLAVALSRLLRIEKEISSALPKIAIISPGPGGIPVAFGVREALNAEQIYWAEREEGGKRLFRQYVNAGEVNPCIIVDDIIRSGKAIQETVALVRELGATVIGCGTIVRFKDAPDNLGEDVPVKSLLEFESRFYDKGEDCHDCKAGAPAEHVRF